MDWWNGLDEIGGKMDRVYHTQRRMRLSEQGWQRMGPSHLQTHSLIETGAGPWDQRTSQRMSSCKTAAGIESYALSALW